MSERKWQAHASKQVEPLAYMCAHVCLLYLCYSSFVYGTMWWIKSFWVILVQLWTALNCVLHWQHHTEKHKHISCSIFLREETIFLILKGSFLRAGMLIFFFSSLFKVFLESSFNFQLPCLFLSLCLSSAYLHIASKPTSLLFIFSSKNAVLLLFLS